jgi:hypothetical protein
MALNPNQLQVININPHANTIIDCNHENLEEKEDNPLITSFNQLHVFYAIRSTYHTTLQVTPCQLVFGRDMIHNIALRANWDQIQKRKQDTTHKSNQKENKNKSQIPYKYKVGDQVLFETPGILRILSTPRIGPYPVTNIYKNGTIRIQKKLHQKE